MQAKKATYATLVECKDEEEKRTNKEIYKAVKTKANLAVTATKTITFKQLYFKLGDKYGDKKLYRLTKAREEDTRP